MGGNSRSVLALWSIGRGHGNFELGTERIFLKMERVVSSWLSFGYCVDDTDS
jgi:hypothetical protein